MRVILKGIKMPERCGLCPCFHAEWPMYCQAVKADKDKRIVAPYGMPRPEWCPILIELPAQHGRLIDADALTHLMGMDEHFSPLEAMYLMELIADAPTIIEAEPSEEG